MILVKPTTTTTKAHTRFIYYTLLSIAGTPSIPVSGDDEDTAEDYYTEEKVATSGKKRRGRKPKVVEPEEQEEEIGEEFAEERPRRKRAYKKSKKALDAAEGRVLNRIEEICLKLKWVDCME